MNEIEEKLNKHFIINGPVKIHPKKFVNVDGDVRLKKSKLIEKLPVQFGTVTGDFDCNNNQLTSLEGAPQVVGRHFNCNMNKLTSLKSDLRSVGGDFDCNNNKLTSLLGAPQSVRGAFSCDYNQLTSLLGASQNVKGYFSCDYNQLRSLEGAPQSVVGAFYCNHNPLTSLEGAPQSVGSKFWLTYNENLGLLKLIINNYNTLQITDAPHIVYEIMTKYREKANLAATPEQRNALAVQCAAELIRAGHRNNARL